MSIHSCIYTAAFARTAHKRHESQYAYREVIVFILVIQELKAFVVAVCKPALGCHVDHNSHLVSKLTQSLLVAINVFYSLQARTLYD